MFSTWITKLNYGVFLLVGFHLLHLCSFAQSGFVYELEDPPAFHERPLILNDADKGIVDIRSGYFNNDSYADLLLQTAAQNKLELKLASPTDTFLDSDWSNLPHSIELQRISITDVDNDGCDDLVIPEDNSTTWTFAISNCRNGFSLKQVKLFDKKYKTEYSLSSWRTNASCPSIYSCIEGAVENKFCAADSTATMIRCAEARCISPFNYQTPAIEFGRTWGRLSVGYFRNIAEQSLIVRHKTGTPDLLLPEFHYVEVNSALSCIEGCWATLDINYFWDKEIVGDFNGDGYSDILIRSSSMMKWWIIVSNGITGIELAAKGLPNENQKDLIYIASDSNGNGREELLSFNRRTLELKAYEWSEIKRIGGVELSSGYGHHTMSNQQGYFELPRLKNISYTVTAQHKNFNFSPRYHPIQLRITNSRKLNFVAIPKVNPLNTIGSAIGLAKEDVGPYVCLSYNPDSTNLINKWRFPRNCPENYAVMSTSAPPKSTSLAKEQINGTCCRLPFDDILTSRHEFTETHCPHGYVVTGFKHHHKSENLPNLLRCTAINNRRYHLSEPKSGRFFGFSRKTRLLKNHNNLTREDLPVAIRYGASRESYSTWYSHGCIFSSAAGGLLLGKAAVTCDALKFSELEYTGAPGDPPSGTTIQLLPDCESIPNVYDPRSGCIPKKNKQ